MSLSDIDHQERNLASILFVELVEGRNLPPEGRSSVAAKYEHHRLSLRRERGQLYLTALVQFGQRKVRRGIANMQRAGAGAHPQGLKWKYEKRDWTRYSSHDSGECLRRLPHDRVQSAASAHPQQSEHTQRRDRSPHPLSLYVH